MRISRRNVVTGAASAMLAAALPGCVRATESAPFDPAHLYPPEVLKAELAWLRDTLVEVGVKPFAYCDETQWRARYTAVSAAFTKPLNAWGFWLAVGPLFAALNDGHAGVSAYNLYDDAREKGLKAFPLILQIRPAGTFVKQQTIDGLLPQTRVVSIDGIDGMQFAHDVARLVGGQRDILRYDFADSRIPPYLYATLGARKGFEVVAETAQGRIKRTLPSMTRSQMARAMVQTPQTEYANYSFSRLADGEVGYIEYRACVDAAAFKRFLEASFSSVRSVPVKGLIIDVRRNGGGSSSLNDDLWSYVTDKPFAQFGGGYAKISNRLKKEYGIVQFSQLYGPTSYFAKDGSVIGAAGVSLYRPGPNPLRYSGPVFLLIGSGTFSSALACAVAARDYGLATIVGEETAEPVNSTGEVYSTRSPQIGLNAAFTTKYFLGPKTRPDGQGVLPDVRIVPTEADIRAGRDPVLAYAVRAARGG